jgi:hypothetical protein
MINAPNTWRMCSLCIFWESIFRSFTCFSLLNLYGKKKTRTFHFLNAFLRDTKCCVKEGRRGRRTWRTARRPGVKQQNVFSQPRFGDNNTDFHVECTPNPDMSLASVKRSPHWSCDKSKKACFSGDLASFLVCARKFIWLYDLLFSHVCMCHVRIRTWSTSELRPSLLTQVHETWSHSWNKIVSRMTQRRFHMSWRYMNVRVCTRKPAKYPYKYPSLTRLREYKMNLEEVKP